MWKWFKRQSTGVQTIVVAVIAVVFLALIAGGEDEEQKGSTTAKDPVPAVTEPAPKSRPDPPGPGPGTVIMAFQRSGLPTIASRITTRTCVEDVPGCVERVTTDSVSVLGFGTVKAARRYVRVFGRDARRNGATVVSYAAARTPNRLRPQYAAVLDAVAEGGNGQAARQRVVVDQRREARQRRLAHERRLARQRAEAERIAAAAEPPPPPSAPEPEPVAAPDYSGMTCAEIGHSFYVTPGSDPEHDADGDGEACESE